MLVSLLFCFLRNYQLDLQNTSEKEKKRAEFYLGYVSHEMRNPISQMCYVTDQCQSIIGMIPEGTPGINELLDNVKLQGT